jgi:transcription elongation factor Elf1
VKLIQCPRCNSRDCYLADIYHNTHVECAVCGLIGPTGECKGNKDPSDYDYEIRDATKKWYEIDV